MKKERFGVGVLDRKLREESGNGILRAIQLIYIPQMSQKNKLQTDGEYRKRPFYFYHK